MMGFVKATVLDSRETPRVQHAPVWKLVIIGGSVLAISLGHYLTPRIHFYWHVVFQNLYYIPILLAAAWYGVRGGLPVALAVSILYLPYLVAEWTRAPHYRTSQVVSTLLLPLFGALAGWLIDRLNREREGHRRTADELRRAYDQLRATFDRLRLLDRLSTLGSLSAGMAHEIRNPLGSMSGAVEILEVSVPEGDERREFVRILKEEVRRLSSIVSRHLDLVRATRPERTPHSVIAIVQSVAALVANSAAKQGVSVRVESAEMLPEAMVDDQQLRQAVLNLVINGIQALPNGGTVVVRTDARDDRVRIIVEDNGPGLSEEVLRRVFEPFYTTKDQGSGLGLSIAFQIVSGHGGDLRAENRPEGGARFVIELPLVPDRTSGPNGADPETKNASARASGPTEAHSS
jgi:two-component system, NtrC family, sensor histidine kinase HydH